MSLLTAYWRFRAEEVRAIADEMKHTETKFILAMVAEDFDRIAKLFENGTLKLQTSPLGLIDQKGESGRGHGQRGANCPSPGTGEGRKSNLLPVGLSKRDESDSEHT